MARTDFAENTLVDPDEATDKPVTLIKRSRDYSQKRMPETKHGQTHPKDTDGVPRAVRRTVGFDHAEHTMELPADEEDDEEVVGIPEVFKVGPPPLLPSKEDYDAERSGHDPASGTGSSGEVGVEEGDELGATCLGVGVCHREFSEIDHVCPDVHGREENDRPCRGLVKGYVLVERDNMIEGRAAEERDKVAAHGEKDKDDVDVEDECSAAGDGCGVKGHYRLAQKVERTHCR